MQGQWLAVKRIISFTLCTVQKTNSCSTSEGRGHMLYYGNNARGKKPLVSKVMCVATSQKWKRWEDAPSSHVIWSRCLLLILSDCGCLLPKNSLLLKCFRLKPFDPPHHLQRYHIIVAPSRISSAISSIQRNAVVCGGKGSSSQMKELKVPIITMLCTAL